MDLDLEACFGNIGALGADLVERISRSSRAPPHFQETKRQTQSTFFAFETKKSNNHQHLKPRNVPFKKKKKPRNVFAADS